MYQRMLLHNGITALSLAIRALWAKIWLRRRPSQPPVVEAVVEQPQPEPQPQPQLNRHERRRLEKWERERRKHDVLVKPAIPPVIPPRIPRKPREHPVVPHPVPVPMPDVPEDYKLIVGDDAKVYHERELFGEFTFRDTILEQLDLYWGYLRRMQQRDADSYEFYKRVGATIVPPLTHFLHDGVRCDDEETKKNRVKEIKLTPWWKMHRPAFGCVTYGIMKKVEEYEQGMSNKKREMWVPKFFYFTKYDRPPPEIAPMSGGDTYKLTIWWDKPFSAKKYYKKGGTPTEYAVFLDHETIRALPMLNTKFISIRHKHRGAHQRRGKTFEIPQRAWGISDVWTDWAKDLDEDPEHLLARIFMSMSTCWEYSNYGMIRVAVHNGDLTAQFVVDPRRMSYFFQDRDIVYTPNGAREACFHIVRAHERHTKTGKTAAVKLHFRGAKEFTWAGYRVTVTIPERDHVGLVNFDVPVSDSYWFTPKERREAVYQKELGQYLSAEIEGRVAERDAIRNRWREDVAKKRSKSIQPH